ncbi:Acetylxylan esterase [Planctomycetales bacterium 10988]|nr:Acetylxylan esterase [Planctomycetales bacterium 10988]
MRLLTTPMLAALAMTGIALHSACFAADEPKSDYSYPNSEAVLFKQVGEKSLFLHVFEPEEASKAKRPAIVFFFGGGWVGGSPTQFTEQAERISKKGMVAFCAEYRIKSRDGVEPFACVEDGKSAIRFVREHADRWNIDSNRIVAAGGSAGGHVAACTALIQEFDSASENLEVSSVPNAMALFNPVIDTSKKGYGYNKLGDRYKELSPVHHVRPELPPTMIVHGTGDSVVPFENVERFTKKMKQAGNQAILHPYSKAPHGFFNKKKNDKHFESTYTQLEEFLASLGYIQLDTE